MRNLTLCLLTLAASAVLSASETGPFTTTPRVHDPSSPTPDMIAADGSVESAALVSGDAQSGRIQLESWAGQTLAGGYGFGGNSLRGPSGINYFVGLNTKWAIREGIESGDGYFYYHRFQQDLRWYAGWADVSGGPLPDRFHIDQAVPVNRLVVSVPLRWVQGGGSAFQTGSYGGNPPQAVVLWVPAGLSLMQAESNPENRLGRISNVFSEFQPHQRPWQVKLQPGGASGAWEVRIDIDADGAVDVDVTSEQEGNRRAPGGMTEDSGLIVTTTNSGGHPAGTIGRTSMEVLYRKSDTEGIASPLNRRPLGIEIPRRSQVSPVRIEAKRWSSAWAVSATSQGQVLATSLLSDRVFVDLPLNKDDVDGTPVAVTQSGGMTATGAVLWEPTNIYNTGSMTVLRGSSILVTYDGNCGKEDIEIASDDGSSISYFHGESGDTTVVHFEKSGDHIITARAEGQYVGSLTVRVIDIRFPNRIVSQVGYERPVVVQTSTISNEDIVFTGTKDVLGVAIADRAGKNIALRVRPNSITGTNPVIYARIGSANGPIIGTAEVVPFRIERSSKGALVSLSLRDNPVSEAKVTLKMFPHIPDLIIKFDMLGGNATFKDGLKTWYLSSDALASPEGYEYVVQIAKAPSRNRATCHNLYFAETRTTASDFSTPYAAMASRAAETSSDRDITPDESSDLLYVSGPNPENDDAVAAELPCCPEVVAGSVTTKVSIFEYGDHKQEYTLKFGKDSGGEEPDPTWDTFTNKTTNDVFTDHPMSGNGIQTTVTSARYSLSLGDQKDTAKVGLIHREVLELEAWDSTNSNNKESSKQATPPEPPLYVLGQQTPNGATKATILIKMLGIPSGMEKCVLWRIDEPDAELAGGSFKGQGDGISIDLKTQLKGNHTYIVRAGVDTDENGELSDSEVSKALKVKVIEVIFDPAFIEIFQGKDIGETTAYIYPADDDVWPKVSFQTTDKKLTVIPANATAAVVPLVIKSTHKGNQELRASLISLVQTKSGTGESGKAQIVVRPLPDYSIAAPKTKTICLGSTHNEFVTLTGDEHTDQKVQITIEKDPAMPNPVGILFANGAAQSPWIDLPKRAVIQVPITITSPAGGIISPNGTTRFTFKATNDSNPARNKSVGTTVFLFNVTGLKTSRPFYFKFSQGQNVQLDLEYVGKLGPDVSIDYVLYDIELAKEAWRKPSSRPSVSGPIPDPGRYVGFAYYCNGKRVGSPNFTGFIIQVTPASLEFKWGNAVDSLKKLDRLETEALSVRETADKIKTAVEGSTTLWKRAEATIAALRQDAAKFIPLIEADSNRLSTLISESETQLAEYRRRYDDAIKFLEGSRLDLKAAEEDRAALLAKNLPPNELQKQMKPITQRIESATKRIATATTIADANALRVSTLVSIIADSRLRILGNLNFIEEIKLAVSNFDDLMKNSKSVSELLGQVEYFKTHVNTRMVQWSKALDDFVDGIGRAIDRTPGLRILAAKAIKPISVPILSLAWDITQFAKSIDDFNKTVDDTNAVVAAADRLKTELDSISIDRISGPLSATFSILSIPGGIPYSIKEENVKWKTQDDTIAGGPAEAAWDFSYFCQVNNGQTGIQFTSSGASGEATANATVFGNLGSSDLVVYVENAKVLPGGGISNVRAESVSVSSTGPDEETMLRLASFKYSRIDRDLKQTKATVEVISAGISVALGALALVLLFVAGPVALLIGALAGLASLVVAIGNILFQLFYDESYVKSIKANFPSRL
jgi:hypothetical protein